MTRIIEFHGDEGDDVQSAFAQKVIVGKHELGADVLEQTEEERMCIRFACDLANQYWKELGYGESDIISPESFSVIQSNSQIVGPMSLGFFQIGFDHIYMKRDSHENRLRFIRNCVHEAWHFVSANKLSYSKKIDPDSNDKIFNPSGRRSGYDIAKYRMGEKEQVADVRLSGFNESIIDKITIDNLNHYINEICDKLGIGKEEFNLVVRGNGYIPNVQILEAIINGISNVQVRKPEEVWKTIRDGIVTGKMMHLRSIERVFGRGSLKVLSAYQSGGTKEDSSSTNRQVLKYFTTRNELERKSIAREILNPQAREAFDRRQLKGVEELKRFLRKGLRRF